ncbi:MAG: serine/threonine-protein phosphatase, partial [Acidobacteria bacterium]|nr:serine/threonine-protein phosphatase [Acidobacteriota bacterium]
SHGLAALLVAATAGPLLRDLLAAVIHPRGNLGPGAVAGLTLVAIAVFGFVGMSRPDREDDVKVEAPEYVRRLESERRVQYEMGLLSRMQLSLLPEKPPEVPGYEISVKTMLATEAGGDLYDFIVDTSGGLWIAAGDVAGHGYSCGIQQAMVKASLASLVKAGRGPGEILGEVDRVLRTLGPQRTFTSLALLCLDPATGRGRIANAGHPYPILLHEGRSTELSVSGLPLGQGPKRTYQELEVELPRGASLLIASDGLFEGPNGFDEPWGYERPRAVLEGIGLFRRPAAAIIEALLADFVLHTGGGPPADDTTLVVLKRAT